MNQNQWQRIESLFHECLALEPEAREQYLKTKTADEPALFSEVKSLLDAEHETGDLTAAVGAMSEQVSQSIQERWQLQPGTQVNQYEVVALLGEGGMGSVYEAVQREPVQRTVALKVIQSGLLNPRTLARFDTEMQALALMDHPSIAKVFDAGTTESSLPYFVMELVKGETLDEFLTTRDLNAQELLQLFIEIARGIEHAHQRGVIHRDLKPSNVLIAEFDGQPQPKIIDFGIAKSTAPEATNKGNETAVGQVVGTPRYMSPEQADSFGLVADTRSDVYALGVMFYEALSGTHPLDASLLESVHPSERIAAFQSARLQPPSRRGALKIKLSGQARADLDLIALKAIALDADQRYASAGELAEDLTRLLNNRPIEARPPNTWYSLTKFYQRNRIPTLAAVAVSVALVIGAGLAIVGLLRAVEAEERALAEAQTAQSVSDFMIGLFEASDPTQPSMAGATAKEILDLGAARLESELLDQPESKANLLQAVGRVYTNLGLHSQALAPLENALNLYETAEVSSTRQIDTKLMIGNNHLRSARGEQALSIAQQALLDIEELQLQGSKIHAAALSLAGRIYQFMGNTEQAVAAFKETLQISGEFEPNTRSHARAMYNLAGAYYLSGQVNEASNWITQAIDTYPMEGDRTPDLADYYKGYAGIQMELGNFEEAETYVLKSLEEQRLLQPDHYMVLTTLVDTGVFYLTIGNPKQADVHLREALERLPSVDNDIPPMYKTDLFDMLARARADLGEFDSARTYAQRAIELRKDHTPKTNPLYLSGVETLGRVEYAAGNYSQAIELMQQSANHKESVLGRLDYDVIGVHSTVAMAMRKSGDQDQALVLYEDSYERMREGGFLGFFDSFMADYQSLLGEAGQTARAELVAAEVAAAKAN